MSDWRSYDTVAGAYERVAAPRFQIVARHLLSLVAPKPGARLLDLGTGTGAVPAAAAAMGLTLRTVVGCDLSSAMLARACLRVPGRHAVRADVVRLPFVEGAFDVATANCVLSHVSDHHSVLREIGRVLTRPGHFASSSWEMASDLYTTTWRELLEAAIGAGAVQRAAEAVAPLEGHFSSGENVQAALLEAGFDRGLVEIAALSFTHSVEDYVADRALGSSGRLGRDLLGVDPWNRFLVTAESEFRQRFGATVSYERRLVLAIGTLVEK
jgi:ubiquinone/menaquinone biosynthesis C-methylase UbiE